MRVLGIDCGTEKTGFGVIESDGVRHKMIAAGVIRTNPRHLLTARLCDIAQGLRATIDLHRPDTAAVEDIFVALNVKSSLKLAHARGVTMLAIAEAGVPVAEYTALQVKMSVVGYGRAEKAQVQRMVYSILELESSIESEDAADAVAVAICHATHLFAAQRTGVAL
jgi:crossover junction endodeoxyribonuclease RuvC